MGILGWTTFWVIGTFSIYIGIAFWSRVKDTKGFYVAGQGVPAIANGMATAADWMSAASFISMAGLIAFMGSDGSVYLMGWTGGYVLLALLLAPFLRKFGKFTVPEFVGERFYSPMARNVAVIAAIFVSFTYVCGQMRGVGVAFGRFLGVPVELGVIIGMAIVAFYAILGGMKGITYTQVAQYCVLIFAYTVPAIAIAFSLTDNPIPQIAISDILPLLDDLQKELLGTEYSSPFQGEWGMLNVFCVTLSLMVGTAGLPHVIVRFYTTKSVNAARWSAGWALLFIAILYTTAPAVGMFAKYYIINSFNQMGAEGMLGLDWVQNWANTGLIATETWSNNITPNEFLGTINRDIIVLATPEIASLPALMVGLVAAGGLAAALSTASGLLLVIGSSISHDVFTARHPEASEAKKLLVARVTIGIAVVIAGFFGLYPPGFVAEVVAFAFGLAAASFFPIIILGIFWKRCNSKGAIAGMITGLAFTSFMILAIRTPQILPFFGITEPWIPSFFGINAQGVGTVGMLLNFAVTITVSKLTPAPPLSIQKMVENLRSPRELTPEELESTVEG